MLGHQTESRGKERTEDTKLMRQTERKGTEETKHLLGHLAEGKIKREGNGEVKELRHLLEYLAKGKRDNKTNEVGKLRVCRHQSEGDGENNNGKKQKKYRFVEERKH